MKRSLKTYLEERSSERVKALASLIDKNSVVYDIGCDHGHVGLYVFCQQGVKRLYLVDQSKAVIDTLQKNINEHNLDLANVRLIHKRGEDLEDVEKSATLVLAGIGFFTMQRIVSHLAARKLLSDNSFIICVNKNSDQVMSFMNTYGYVRVEERLLVERQERFIIEKYISSVKSPIR